MPKVEQREKSTKNHVFTVSYARKNRKVPIIIDEIMDNHFGKLMDYIECDGDSYPEMKKGRKDVIVRKVAGKLKVSSKLVSQTIDGKIIGKMFYAISPGRPNVERGRDDKGRMLPDISPPFYTLSHREETYVAACCRLVHEFELKAPEIRTPDWVLKEPPFLILKARFHWVNCGLGNDIRRHSDFKILYERACSIVQQELCLSHLPRAVESFLSYYDPENQHELDWHRDITRLGSVVLSLMASEDESLEVSREIAEKLREDNSSVGEKIQMSTGQFVYLGPYLSHRVIVPKEMRLSIAFFF